MMGWAIGAIFFGALTVWAGITLWQGPPDRTFPPETKDEE